MNDKPNRRPAILAAGAAAVVVAGLVGVYVGGGWIGNTAGGRCSASTAAAAALKPLVAGDLAALIVAEEPADLSGLAFFATDGTRKTLADFAGTAVLLNLWATWCAPCREEMPALDRLQAAMAGSGFAVVTVNIDVGDPAKPAAFLKTAAIRNLPDYRDPRMAIFNDLKTRGLAFGMPTTLVVDKAGCQLAALHGPAAWDSEGAVALARRMAAGT